MRNSGTSPSEHPVLAAMRDIVLPNLLHGGGRIVTLREGEVQYGTDYREIFPMGIHRHEHYEWMWLIGSDTHINIEGTIYHMVPGDFCLIPPRVSHAELYSPRTQPYQSLWCSYYDDAIFCGLCHFTTGGRILARDYCAARAEPIVGTLLATLESELRGNSPYTLAVRRSLLSTFAHLLTRGIESALSTNEAEGIPGVVARRVENYLREHYAENISITDVARAVRMSRNHLSTTYKRDTGKTIGEALTEIRMEQAKTLLRDDNLPVNAVAKAVGYSSPEHFCRIFQRYERVPPSRYGRWSGVTELRPRKTEKKADLR